MIKIGITGQPGFVGTHLFNTLNLQKDKYQTIPFEDSFFASVHKLSDWVMQCDVIVHLAAMNRHNDPDVIYKTNIALVQQLIDAMQATQSTPHVLFSSSTQEERDNLYGRSKKEGRRMLEEWALLNKARFTGLVIPNVFGPFGNPYYNSVVATFCHQLTHNETPAIDIDGEIKLIYVAELVNEIITHIDAMQIENRNNGIADRIEVPHTSTIRVSELLAKLKTFKADYFGQGMIPDLSNTFDRNLFNTFLCYTDHKSFFPFHLKLNTDQRGSFVETVKLSSGGQISFSTTVPGVTRGNHFHTRKSERFAVIKGKALIQLRKIGTDKILNFELSGDSPSFVDMPIWHTHNITNIGNEELYTIFWINEFFNPDDADTFFEVV
jgi:UDP-2-acetamido-2,6-beta-L-arabino-hexul-4-ose reductase